MANVQSKMAHVPVSKLWTHERRLFLEKFFYLNKSTTKYMIVGIDPETFEHRVRICDRVSGCNISIPKENFFEFVRVIDSVLTNSYSLERGVITTAGPLCGIKFHCHTGEIWKLTPIPPGAAYTSLLIHISSFKTILQIAPIIMAILNEAEVGKLCAQMINDIRADTVGMTEAETMSYLTNSLEKFLPGCIGFDLTANLICNKDSYVDVPTFREEFYHCNKK